MNRNLNTFINTLHDIHRLIKNVKASTILVTQTISNVPRYELDTATLVTEALHKESKAQKYESKSRLAIHTSSRPSLNITKTETSTLLIKQAF